VIVALDGLFSNNLAPRLSFAISPIRLSGNIAPLRQYFTMMDAMNGSGEEPTPKAASPANADLVHSEDNAQSNAINETSAADDGAPSNAASKTSSTRNSSPAAPASENQQSAQDSNDTSSAMDVAQQSRDVASTEPNSARPSRKESEEAAAPYGTRSRNRPGRSRINYAEDTEMDFEMTTAPPNGNASEPLSRNSAAAESGPPPAVGGKKGASAGQGSAPWGSSGPISNDHPTNANIPGTSAFTAANQQATTAQPATKRRKNAAKDATNGTHAHAAAPSPAAAKRGIQPATATPGSRETNMMTFEGTGALLKNGRLETDDGQTISINGEFLISPRCS
jgi:hypothetical protein